MDGPVSLNLADGVNLAGLDIVLAAFADKGNAVVIDHHSIILGTDNIGINGVWRLLDVNFSVAPWGDHDERREWSFLGNAGPEATQ